VDLIQPEVNYDGHLYYDDRLFISYVVACTIYVLDRDYFSYEIHHESLPDKHLWCVVIYHNTERYLAHNIFVFETKSEAEDYKMELEPGCPLASLNGIGWGQRRLAMRGLNSDGDYEDYHNSEESIADYKDYCKWKEQQGFEEYDYRKMSAFNLGRPIELMTIEKTPKSMADYELMKRIKKNE
jgi:hypothetical protein